jgi:HEAT repeat protein
VPFLSHEDAAVRRLAISACVASGLVVDSAAELCRIVTDDEDGAVRAMAAEALGGAGEGCDDALMRGREDDDPRVVEAVATAYGEQGDLSAVPWLVGLASNDGDRSAREAAVAALGAIGDDSALVTLLDLVASAPPQVRRRAVVALTVFEDPAVDLAIQAAARDRNPSVREAAEMVVGRQPD